MLKSTVEFKTSSNKHVQASLKQDRYGDYSIEQIIIGKAIYSSKQIRSVSRENRLFDIINEYVNIDEHFHELRWEKENPSEY